MLLQKKVVIVPALLFAFVLTANVKASSPWLPIDWVNVAQKSETQPDGVEVTIANGHAIIDFSERAKMNSESSVQFFSPDGPELEEDRDAWKVSISEPLEACLAFCDQTADPQDLEACRDFCYKSFGGLID